MIFKKNQKGIALILVLGILVILSALVVEMAEQAHISYELVSTERDRLKAFYLARSAIQMVRLEVKIEKQLRSQFANLLQNLQGAGVVSDPLCKQIPLSTGLLKGLAQGGLTASADKKPDKKETKPAKEEKIGEPSESAKEFLQFDGDFDVVCDTEERKINVNLFRSGAVLEGGETTGLASETPPQGILSGDRGSLYENQKQLLTALLNQSEFDSFFEGKRDLIKKIVNSIADWVDPDDRINEAPGIAGGSEQSEYPSTSSYKVKNGKYTSLAELLLLPEMTDDLFQKLAPHLTLYGEAQINVCQAEDTLLKAFVIRTLQTVSNLTTPPRMDESRWQSLLTAVHLACNQPSPQVTQIAQAISGSLGLTGDANLARQITTSNRFYRFEATGVVGDSQVKIRQVIDTGGGQFPGAWKTLYFQIE